jgi:thiol-disulfide isomerase/thioredoxin
MKDINGNIISSEKAKGKVMVLNFWFIDWGACAPELPEVNAAYEKYKDNKDIIFAAITFDKLDKVKTFLKESKSYIKYPIVTDGDDIVDLFGIDGFPTNIIIDKKGYYYYKSSGYDMSGRPSGIAKKIEAALQGKKAKFNE